MTATVDYDPTAVAYSSDPMTGAPTLAAGLELARNWQRWTATETARTDELAAEVVGALAFAATLAQLPASVLSLWVNDLEEPIDILTAFGHLETAARLDFIDTLPPDDRTPIQHAALKLACLALADPATRTPAAPTGGADEWVYDSLIGWMDGFFFPVFERPVSASKQPWCIEWWRHPEAVQRLNALWRAWEELRLLPGADWSTWWTHHLDAHLRALTDLETGTFSQCGAGHKGYAEQLPHTPPPPDWQLPTVEANQP